MSLKRPFSSLMLYNIHLQYMSILYIMDLLRIIKLVRHIFSFALIFALVSCSVGVKEAKEKATHSTQQSEITQINFIGQWLNEGMREDLVRNVARSYEFEHQNVRVNLKFPEEVYYKREDMFSNQRFVAEEVKKEVGYWDILRINGEMEVIAEFAKDPEWAAKYLVDFSQMEEYKKYIYGSAEVVGLMCLKVFVKGDEQRFEELKQRAQSLGSAFQKINFLRDLKSDFDERGRIYFPGITNHSLSDKICKI